MIVIEYPIQDFRFMQAEGKKYIFDMIRKKWLVLTPEEWVRQNFLNYLIRTKKYPAALIAVEKQIKYGELKRRCDLVIYRNDKPWMIVECKESDVPLSNETIEQILRYNQVLAVDYLVLTNGVSIFAWQLNEGEAIPLDQIPDYTT